MRRAVTDSDVQRLTRAGIQRLTVPLPWSWCERQRGRWDFAAVDHFLAPVDRGGLPLQATLGPGISEGWPPWVLSDGGADHPDYIERFAAYCAALATHRTDIGVFRVEEDLNAAFWWDGLRTRKRKGNVWKAPSFRR